jgi:carboxyl-terminal processing protease
MSKRQKFNRTNKRARSYNATLALRAIALGLVVAPVIVLGLFWIGRPAKVVPPPRVGIALVSEFAPNATPQDLSRIFKDVATQTEARFVERDKVVQVLQKMRKEYKDGTIHSKQQLDQALIDYLSTLNDRYATVMSTQQYVDLMVSLSGQQVGVELNFTSDSATGNWVVQQMAQDGPAAQAGIQVGDMLVSVEGYHVEELKKIGNVGELVQFLLSQAGVLGSKAKITLRRGVDVFDFEVERTVIKTHPALSVQGTGGGGFEDEEMMMMGGFPGRFGPGGGSGSDLNAQYIKVNFMDGETFLREFESVVNKLVEDGVQGVVLDLANVAGGNGDTAIQAAALFIDSGVIAHCVKNVEGDAIEMHTYSARDGKVYLTVKGPFRKDSSGNVVANKDAKDREEALPWKSGVFKGEVVIGVNGGTQGAAELLAGAIQKNRHTMVVGTDVSFGKGMNVTYFPVSPDHVVRFSTAVYLQPDGASIEKRGIMPNVGVQEFEYSRALVQVLEQRLRIVPYPTGPVQPEKAGSGKQAKKLSR